MEQFDVIVIGGGHAGCEAALASARMGAKTAIVTLDPSKMALMPCNPSIGGVGKGQLVKEIDALGGEMGRNADFTAIQFRRLNTRKGSAVQSSRCQSDKDKYASRMQSIIDKQEHLSVVCAEVKSLRINNGKIHGVELEAAGSRYDLESKAVVLTTGTFMSAVMHCGDSVKEGGRTGEAPSMGLSGSLEELGLRLIRLKTGTPPRLLAETIDFSRLQRQPGDVHPYLFSFSDTVVSLPQIDCHLGFTNERTHDVIQNNLDRSPLYSGQIKGIGPRYCPSIEDKVVKFPDKSRHQVFFEPVSLKSNWIYPNGISTSLPKDVQEAFIRTIEGCESAQFGMFGYAVEYDCVDPTQLKPTLESKTVDGLYFGGQVNGTSGYEEAAAQGLLAGINAAASVFGKEPLVLSRSNSYIGVMVDDLTTQGVTEPYRMFTSRAEFRLSIREDNADIRLRGIGHAYGLVSDSEFEKMCVRRSEIEATTRQMKKTFVKPVESVNAMLVSRGTNALKNGESLAQLLKRPEIGLVDVEGLVPGLEFPSCVKTRETLEIELKYEGYIEIQRQEIARLQKLENTEIPEGFDYTVLNGLSFELKDRLSLLRPKTLADAAKLPAVTPAALTNILFSLQRRAKNESSIKTQNI